MSSELQIGYKLKVDIGRDEECKVFVGYIPALRLHAQSKNEDTLRKALQKGIVNFIRLCHVRGVLDDVMRERGFYQTRDSKKAMDEKSADAQYIIVGTPASEETFAVPISLLAARQETLACQLQ